MLELKLPAPEITQQDIQRLADEFHQMHKDLFTFSLPWVQVEIQNLHLTAKIKSPKIPVKKIPRGNSSPAAALKEMRICYFENKPVETPVYDGLKLKSGNIFPGQAIIEEPTTTTVIPAGSICSVDDYGDYIVVKKYEVD
jgi:N-methylhydantoinase A